MCSFMHRYVVCIIKSVFRFWYLYVGFSGLFCFNFLFFIAFFLFFFLIYLILFILVNRG